MIEVQDNLFPTELLDKTFNYFFGSPMDIQMS